MYQQFAFWFPDDVAPTTVGAVEIRTAFVLALPFRVRTGSLFRAKVGDSFTVIFRNPIDIPAGTTLEEILALGAGRRDESQPYAHLFSEALLIDEGTKPSPEVASRVIAFLQDDSAKKMPEVSARFFEALTRLNDAITGYHHATGALFGGTVLERLTTQSFFAHLRYVHVVACPEGHQLTNSDIEQILDARGARRFVQVGGQLATSELADIPSEQADRVQEYIQLHRRFLFYQFALDAKTKMVEQDFVSAILFAVVALEGAHAALLQLLMNRRLARSVADPEARASQVEVMANRLLMDVGLSEALEMTALLALEEAERPSLELVQQCKLGITIRNEIMHALAKKGQYRLRNRTNQQITEAYKSVLGLYKHFAQVLESEVGRSAPQQVVQPDSLRQGTLAARRPLSIMRFAASAPCLRERVNSALGRIGNVVC